MSENRTELAVRLRDRRRGLCRLRIGESVICRSVDPGLPAGGRRQGQSSLGSYSRRILLHLDHPRADWRYRTEPEPGLNDRVLKYPRGPRAGRNLLDQRHGLHSRPRAGLRRMATAWKCRLELERCAALFQGARKTRSVAPAKPHGVGGELSVDDLRASWEISRRVPKGRDRKRRIPATDDFNGGESEGIGYFQ